MLSECRHEGICRTSFLKLRIQDLMLVLPPPTAPPLRAGAAWYNSLNTVGPQVFVKLNCLRVGDIDKIIWVIVTLTGLCLISFLRKPPWKHKQQNIVWYSCHDFSHSPLDTNRTIFSFSFKLMSWVLFPIFMLGLYLILSLIIKDIWIGNWEPHH